MVKCLHSKDQRGFGIPVEIGDLMKIPCDQFDHNISRPMIEVAASCFVIKYSLLLENPPKDISNLIRLAALDPADPRDS